MSPSVGRSEPELLLSDSLRAGLSYTLPCSSSTTKTVRPMCCLMTDGIISQLSLCVLTFLADCNIQIEKKYENKLVCFINRFAVKRKHL